MIVNPLAEGWEVFYHRGHALLAAQIGMHLAWRIGEKPARFIETVAAISHHDDAAVEWEDGYLGPAGTPLDFTLQASQGPISVEPLDMLVERARYRGRWVALLVSLHCCFLNEPKRGQSKELDAFLRRQADWQKRWVHDLGITKTHADEAYAFMQWCDRLSLMLCQRELPSRERALEISAGPDGKRYDAKQLVDGSVVIMPWPFDTPEFSVDAEATWLSQSTFKSDKAFIEALRAAPIKTVEWRLAKTGKSVNKTTRRRRGERHRALPEGEE